MADPIGANNMKNIFVLLLFLFSPVSSFGSLDFEIPIFNERNSFQDIEDYKKGIIKIHNWLKTSDYKKISINVTLKNSVNVKDFNKFLSKNNLSSDSITLLMVDHEGEKVTGHGTIESTLNIIDDLREDNQNILGIYAFKGFISVSNLYKFQNSFLVYLVDVLEDDRLLGKSRSFEWQMIQ